ncbi:MAG: 3-phosphoshikimate 1-carboxyvinyltransferase [Bacteroidales bacterium]|jgi:3-phosphoshikimate 1-carboxyvinyltransferase|nr:3-phosphoshikimate 1-carboxyvinyltransferase [Bacteroidales bacterium]
MICVSLQNKDYQEILEILKTVEMAEIRLDRCALEDEEIEALFADSDVPLIATCRLSEEPQAPELLELAIRSGAKYADLEMEAPAAVGRRIREACREYGSVLIRSYHNYEDTPSLETLQALVERARTFGGEVVKIVTTAHSEAHNATVAALYKDAVPGSLVAFCMGEAGKASRLDALRYGAPFTYACLSKEDATAPGQWTWEEMKEAVYKDFRFVKAEALPLPSSKSFAQRAIIAAALAEGTTHLSGYTPCGDNESAINVAKSLGAEVKIDGNKIVIRGIGATPGSLNLEQLHCGESGFLTRLIIPVLSVVSKNKVRVSGEKTLLNRPLTSAHDIMASFGVRLYPEGGNERKQDCYLPLTVSGPLIAGRADVSGKGGSQLISGLLAALPLCEEKSALYVHDPRSIPYLFITVDVLKKFGIRMSSEMEGGDDFLETQDWALCTGVNFHIKGGQRYKAADFAIEADWSGAAPFLVAGAIFGDIEVEGLDTESLQADISIMDILMEAGASMSQLDSPGGPIHVRRAPLSPFHTDLNNCPDLFPMVAVLAAFCPGKSHILGVERLRHKETDRAAAIEQMLTQMGVPVQIEEDEMTIEGIGLTQRLLEGKLLRGGRYISHADHRMVMALKVAALGANGPIEIDDTACVAKSFPSFNALFDRL